MLRVSFKELIREVSEQTGITEDHTRLVVESTFNTIREHMLKGNSVLAWRFGVFTLKKRKARRAHNVCFNEVVDKPESTYPKLDFSRNFMKY